MNCEYKPYWQMDYLGLARWIVNICRKIKICLATSVQQACIPPILDRKDVIALSGTGTGKTLTFLLPTLHLIEMDKIGFKVFILVPTRELGLQIYDSFNQLGKIKKISSFFLTRYKLFNKYTTTISSIFRKERTIITTPEYLKKILGRQRNRIKKKISMFIIDESDLIFEIRTLSFIEKIFSKFKIQQTLLFAATMTKNLKILKKLSYCKNLFYFQEKQNQFLVFSKMKQEYLYCSHDSKIQYLKAIIKSRSKFFYTKNHTFKNTIIFVSSKKLCEKLFNDLKITFVRIGRLHGNMDLITRILTMQTFVSGKINILICTDLGNRGIDCPFVDLVINFNFPKNISTYIHRSGRSGRFNRNGCCLSLIGQAEIPFLHFLENKIGMKINKSEIIQDLDILKSLIQHRKMLN
nr:transcription factor protein [Cryptomonas sp.]